MNAAAADMSRDTVKKAPSLTAENSFGQPPPSMGGTPSKAPAKPDWGIIAVPSDRSSSPAAQLHADAKENAMILAYNPGKVSLVMPDMSLECGTKMPLNASRGPL